MKAVILAAGEGKRMSPLTLNTPKPLLKVNAKPIIEYVLESFPPQIDEVIIVVKYLGDQIKDYVGTTNGDRRVRYVLGSDKGTAYSFLAAKKFLANQRFLFINGDEIPDSRDVRNCLKKDLSILVFKPQDPEANGIAYLRADGTIEKIIEKPKKSTSDIAVDGVMVLNSDIFSYKPASKNGEYYFTSMVGSFVQDHKVSPVAAKDFIGDLTTPNDLVRVGNILRQRY